jgi:TPR repeat protein
LWFFTTALKFYKIACKVGSARGCSYLGVAYGDKWRDYYKSAESFEKACKGGYARGCSNLDELYYYGNGVKQDKSNMEKYYNKACKLGERKYCD